MARSSDASFPMSLIRDKTFQLRQIRRVVMLTAFFIVQSTLILGVFYYAFLGNLVEGNAPLLFASEDLGGVSEAVPPMSAVLSRWLLVMLIVNGIVTSAIAVYIMRKLGNPILAIRRALNEIGDGNLNVRLRVNDNLEFSELCESLNRALEQVNFKISEARKLTRIIEELDDQPPPDVDTVRDAMAKANNVLSYFDHDKDAGNDDVKTRNGTQ